jgi:hypothetical protein
VSATPCDMLFDELEQAGLDPADVRLPLDRDGWRVEVLGMLRPAQPTPEQALRDLLGERGIRPRRIARQEARLKCESKIAYPTWPVAEMVRHYIEAWTRREAEPQRFESYPCTTCGAWHHATVRTIELVA